MGSVRTLAATCTLAALAWLCSSPARASNIRHPRTPVLWPEAPCIQDVERAPGASLEFDYAIPYEDTQVSSDELDDSRTHQFVAFCRQWPAGEPPPPYISVADLQRAIDAQIELDAALLEEPEATLETSLEWAGCWTRVSADDARRPITEAAAAEPVSWSVEGVAAGTWMLAGYTWEPPLNMWSRAPGVVRVLDPAAQAPPQPAATVALTPEGLELDSSLTIPVCLAAEPEAQLHFEWAVAKDEPRVWTSALAQAVGEAAQLELEFPSDPEYQGATLLLRARVEGLEASYISHGLVRLNVYAPPLGGEDEGEGEETGAQEESGAESEESGGSSSGADDGGQAEAGGGGCQLGDSAPIAPLLAFASLALAARMPRRRDASDTPPRGGVRGSLIRTRRRANPIAQVPRDRCSASDPLARASPIARRPANSAAFTRPGAASSRLARTPLGRRARARARRPRPRPGETRRAVEDDRVFPRRARARHRARGGDAGGAHRAGQIRGALEHRARRAASARRRAQQGPRRARGNLRCARQGPRRAR